MSASLSRRIQRELFDLHGSEWSRAAMLSGAFFLVTAVFWIIKPIKRGLMLSTYEDAPLHLMGMVLRAAEVEQLAKLLNVVVAVGVVAGFTWLVRRFGRARLVLLVPFGLAALFVLLATVVSANGPIVAWSLYVVGDMYSTIMVGTFWAVSNDIMHKGEPERAYGIVGLGGVIGGFIGATVVRGWVGSHGRAPLLLGAAGLIVLVGIVLRAVERRATQRTGPRPRLGDSTNGRAGAWREGAMLVGRSRDLLGICALVAVYEVVSNIVDYQLAATVELNVAGDTAKDAFFGLVGQLTGVVSIVVQLLLTSMVMHRFGLGVALLLLPLSILGGSLGFLVAPTLAVAAVMSTSDNALNYSINQSAREALYVPLGRHAKYKAKAFIDMFVQRLAKMVSVFIVLLATELLGLSQVRWLSLVAIPLLAGWTFVARWLGRRNEALLRGDEDDDSPPPHPTDQVGHAG